MRTKLFSLILASFVILPFQASARECTFGNLGDDNFMKISFNEASIEFQVHESSFEIPDSKYIVSANNRLVLIPKRSFKVFAEGTSFNAKIQGRIDIPKGKRVIVDLVMDGTTIARRKNFRCDL
jgi:hypothetical protein